MAAREGMKLVRKGQQMTEVMRDGVITGAPSRPGDPEVQGGAGVAQFQKKFQAYDSRDNLVNTKMQLMNNEGMTPFGQVYFSDKDAEWLERKRAVAEAANYDSWFNSQFNKPDLAARQFAQQINPDFYASREREMMDRVNEVVALKKIQLRGPQSKEDLYKIWLINSGRVVLPADWDRIAADPTASMQTQAERDNWNKRQFESGLIKMPLFLTYSQRHDQALDTALRSVPFASGDPSVGARNPFFSWGSTARTENNKLARGQNTFEHLALNQMREGGPA